MMGGPMPVRGPGQGPRGTGAGMRGQMGRGDYGKYRSDFMFIALVDIPLDLIGIKHIHTCLYIYIHVFVCNTLIAFRHPFNNISHRRK